MTLIEHLQQIRDFRTQPVYPLWVVLLLVIMGTMSGCTGYRPLAEFVHRHQDELLDVLELPKSRLPSLSTLRRVLVRVDYEQFTAAFNAWAQAAFGALEHEQLATDGKAVKASLRDYEESYQDFVALVSAFSVSQGIVMAVQPMQNGKTSEIQTVQTLLDKLQLTGVCLSLDALHTQKNLAAHHPARQ